MAGSVRNISQCAGSYSKSICAAIVSHPVLQEGSFLCCRVCTNLVLGGPRAQTGDMTLDELRAMLEEAARPARAAAAADGLAGVAVLAAAATDAALGMQVRHWACVGVQSGNPASLAATLAHAWKNAW